MKRAEAIGRALDIEAPALPAKDRTAVIDRALGSRQMAHAPAPVAAWAALVAYARHGFSDYDALLAEGYDREAARHFTAEAVAAVLSGWGCRNPLPTGISD
ncbi:DUF2293 domain-containing protein [Zavarzinia aquatilis]|uniref:DUF2293 domain-containing protein n=1 Tax=Zavarzinia aquatilis TaxID=2211142 RepID=A0A317EAP1_9PROT|nr:DUF2293 domain-containing protein [Zavarzinia aquatilis]PWR24178.1 DUF2293 domain-containing protein [Zavarzinia aquatilis]